MNNHNGPSKNRVGKRILLAAIAFFAIVGGLRMLANSSSKSSDPTLAKTPEPQTAVSPPAQVQTTEIQKSETETKIVSASKSARPSSRVRGSVRRAASVNAPVKSYWKISDLYSGKDRELAAIDADAHDSQKLFLKSTPKLDTENRRPHLHGDAVDAELTVKGRDIAGVILATSRKNDFPAGQTRFEKLALSELKLKLQAEGNYYYKVRGFNTENELSGWSAPVKIKVLMPNLLPPPKLSDRQLEITAGQTLALSWKPVSGAVSYQVMTQDKDAEPETFESTATSWQAPNHTGAGRGTYWVQARDKGGRLGEKAKGFYKYESQKLVKNEELPVRKVAAVEVPAVVAVEVPVVVAVETAVPTPVAQVVEKPMEKVYEPAKVLLAPVAVVPTPEASPVTIYKVDEDFNHFFLWAGYGMSYTNINQDAGGLSSIRVSGFRPGSIMFKGGFWATPQLGVELNYKQTPGKARSSSSLTLDQENFNWQTASAEAVFRTEPNVDGGQWGLRVGGQSHTVPFFVPVSTTNISLYENSILTASIGGDYKKRLSKKVNFEMMMRYQRTLGSSTVAGSNFSIQSQFVFDGSVGATYLIRPDFYFGLFWYGQSHNYRFNFQDPARNLNFTGEQSLIHSTGDLRLGFEF